MKYEVIRTDTADEGIRKIILYAAQNFENTVALEKLNQIEKLNACYSRWMRYTVHKKFYKLSHEP